MVRNSLWMVLLSLLCASGLCFGQDDADLPKRLSLEECRKLAVENSFASKEAKLNLKAAKYQRGEALAEYFPRVQFTAAGFHSLHPLFEIGFDDVLSSDALDLAYLWANETGSKTSYVAPSHGYTTGVQLIQPVFAGLRIVRGNQLASLGVRAAELQQNVQSRKTIEELDEYYWQTVALEEKRQTLSSFITMIDALYADAESALASGLITEGDYLQAKLKRNELLAMRSKLSNGIKLSKLNLLNYIGLSYEFLKIDELELENSFALGMSSGSRHGSSPSSESMYGSVSQSVSSVYELPSPSQFYADEQSVAANLEELALLELNIQAKTLQKQMEFGASLPQLLVGGTYSYMKIGEKRDKWNGLAFAALSVPISDWWKNSLKQARLQTEIDKAKAQRDYLSEQLVLLVRKTWVELTAAWDEYGLAIDSEAAASASYERERRRYEAGYITLSELLQSSAQFQQASNTACDARIAYAKALQRWLDFQ